MSKVIFKMTFKHPNRPDTVSKNVSHVGYIATRDGVDKSITESDLNKEISKGVEDLSSDDEAYLQYIDERPRSHGLFGKDGIEELKDVQEELKEIDSFVWRGIVSLKENDAKKLGYLDKNKWQNMLRKKIPDMANEIGIKQSNLRWVAAVHMEKGHPHAHIIFWEKHPERTVGVINSKSLDNIRKSFTDEIFEDERLELLNSKNLMRDLLKDLAKDDVGKATRIAKELKEEELYLKSLGITEPEGVMPRLYPDKEKYLAEKVKNLARIMPGKGRVALKFMPDNVKEEVRTISEYILKQPEFAASLAKNLKAVEELTKMYTGKEEDIKKAVENAFNDIRDRVSQIVLKGAAESRKKNLFYLDEDLSKSAVEFIKNLNTQINIIPEQTKVLQEIAAVLVKTGHSNLEVIKHLNEFMIKENINYPIDTVINTLKQIRNSEVDNQGINTLSSGKKIDYYLSVLKLSGYNEDEAFNIIRDTIKKDSEEFEKRLIKLSEDGFLKYINGYYKLTNRGVDELLKIKELDKVEKEILKALQSEGEVLSKVKFKEFLDNKDIFSNLHDKDPEEFKLGRYDARVRNEFGEKNIITFKELEARVYEKYTDEEFNVNTDKADVEIELLKNRIEKLALNGYVKLDRETGEYSFIDEVNVYFKYDQEKESYIYTDEAMKKLNIKNMEFSRYDAKVTLSYIDKCENRILSEDNLKVFLDKEIVNQTAKKYYESFSSLLDFGQVDDYITVTKTGNLISTVAGKALSKDINMLNKYFKHYNGELTENKLLNICNREYGPNAKEHFKSIMDNINKLKANGHIDYDNETGILSINSTTKNINNFLYQIYKAGGSINKDELKNVLEKNIPNKEAENQFKYLIKRLDNLKELGYLNGEDKKYTINQKGIEKREDLLIPQRGLLKNKLEYLCKLGLIQSVEGEYQVADKYYYYIKNATLSKEEKIPRTSNFIPKDIADIIDRTQDKVDVGKIERNNNKTVNGKYINNEYENIKSDHDSMRNYCNVPDTVTKTLNNLATTLLVSGISPDEVKVFIQQWNINSKSNIDPEKINSIIDKAVENFDENNFWGKTTVISSKEWKNMFTSLGIDENNIPKWIYKGENWAEFNQKYGLQSIITDIWKAAWSNFERDRMQNQAEAEYMMKNLNKQHAASRSKAARKEQIKKNKSRSSFNENELDF